VQRKLARTHAKTQSNAKTHSKAGSHAKTDTSPHVCWCVPMFGTSEQSRSGRSGLQDHVVVLHEDRRMRGRKVQLFVHRPGVELPGVSSRSVTRTESDAQTIP